MTNGDSGNRVERIEHVDGAFIERTGPHSTRAEVPETHCCGAQGFGLDAGDVCPACERHKSLRLELQAAEDRERAKAAAAKAQAPVVLEVVEAFRFESFQQWVDTAKSMPWTLEHCSDGGKFAREVCVDAQGRVCRNGGDFILADAEGAFPVVAYRIVRAIPAPAEAPPIATTVRALLQALEAAVPPPDGQHHAITFNRYGSDVSGWQERLGLHVRVGAGFATFFLDDADFARPIADVVSEVLRGLPPGTPDRTVSAHTPVGRCSRCGHYHLDGDACGFHQCGCKGADPAPETPACCERLAVYDRHVFTSCGRVRQMMDNPAPAGEIPDAQTTPATPCQDCGGLGTITRDILVGGTEHDTEEVDCETCGGRGTAIARSLPAEAAL